MGARAAFDVSGAGVRVYIKATPGAARDAISGLWTGADGEMRFAVKVAAAPDKGKANAAIIRLLAKALGVSKSSIAVIAGETARLKTLEIAGDPDALSPRLAALAER